MKNNILIVDDKEIIHISLRQLFEEQYNLFFAFNTKQADKHFYKTKIDLLIIDYILWGGG
ncbi:MAG: hypothetical protein A2252_08005 [Elusimicrobia bacterium RIFOXYA2_FULL_39_19]|nr:MAG: hypothetical protein A2252_08005 [Elusimicrobia bacterium RIFOXYA2_FULL_39_19]